MNKNVITIKIFIDAGEARGGPPLGPVLGQYQIDINSFCKEFNEKTASIIKGVPIPVIIIRFENKTYKLIVKKPTINFIVKQLSQDIQTLSVLKVYDVIQILNSFYSGKYNLNYLSKLVFSTLSSMNIKIVR